MTGTVSACGLAPLVGCSTPSVLRTDAAPGAPPPFSTPCNAGIVPRDWHPHVMRRDLPVTDYRCGVLDGRPALHAVAQSSTSGLRCDVDIDPVRTPWIRWSWRVDRFPAEASIANDDRDDSPARVVLAFDGDVRTLGLRDRMFNDLVELVTGQPLPFATLMYSWDGHAALEQVIAYPRSSRIQYVVVESGLQHTGRWLSYRRNVRDDYRRVFGGEPGRIRHVGVLTDGDDLKKVVEGWYGDIAFEA